jgi:hypothetical protein
MVMRLGAKTLTHLYRRCIFVGSTRNKRRNSSPIFAIVLFYCIRQRAVHLPLRAVVSSLLECRVLCHLPLHCVFVRPGTSLEIADQSLPLCFFTASVSVLSSSAAHLPFRAVVSMFFECRVLCHLQLFTKRVLPLQRHFVKQLREILDDRLNAIIRALDSFLVGLASNFARGIHLPVWPW